MLPYIFLCFAGICSGCIVASGITGLIIGLSIIPRYAGATHTASNLLLYEDMALLGTITGNIIYLFQISLPFGTPFLILAGTFFGIFLGSWILALAEILSVFPIFARRIRLTKGFAAIVLCISFGKVLGCLLFYYSNWQ